MISVQGRASEKSFDLDPTSMNVSYDIPTLVTQRSETMTGY